MELTIYDIIRGPVISTKAQKLNKTLKKLMVYIHKHATKKQVKDALEKLFKVKVKKVNTLRSGSKSRKLGQRRLVRPGKKKAIVTLKKGYTLDFLNQGGASDVTVSDTPSQAA